MGFSLCSAMSLVVVGRLRELMVAVPKIFKVCRVVVIFDSNVVIQILEIYFLELWLTVCMV